MAIAMFAPIFNNVNFVYALNSTDTGNIAYFEGYSPNKCNEAIHHATRLANPSEDAPSMTILVHGQEGNASHWSNDGSGNFFYDETSIIEVLRGNGDFAEVYWARMAKDSNGDEKDDAFFEVNTDDEKGYYFPYISDRFFLTKMHIDNYAIDGTMPEAQEFVTKITDISKHIIVVFESSVPSSYHRDVYHELHIVIDRLSYDILYLTGKIPKVNLISHSRGGLISMMYASGYRQNGKLAKVKYSETYESGYIDIGDGMYEKPATYNQNSYIINDHPYNVAELYSMGTPYWGTDWDTMFGGLAHGLLETGTFDCESAKNILDETIQEEIHGCWQIAVAKNSDLKLHAIAGTFNLSFVCGLLIEDYSTISELVNNAVYGMYLNFMNGVLTTITTVINAIMGGLSNGSVDINIPSLGCSFNIPDDVSDSTVSEIDDLCNNVKSDLDEFEETYDTQLSDETNVDQTIYGEFFQVMKDIIFFIDEFIGFIGCFTGEENILHDLGDLFVDTESQLATGFAKVETYERLFKYDEIVFEENEEGNLVVDRIDRNFEYKKSLENVAIPHLLETRDSEIIQYITNHITLDVLSTIYDYEVLEDDTIKITGISLPDYYLYDEDNLALTMTNLELGLEAGIGGRSVSCIDSSAFSYFVNLEKITIAESVNVIKDSAFEGCENLLCVIFEDGSELTTIEDFAFLGCTDLSTMKAYSDPDVGIVIPSGVTTIGSGAFSGSGCGGYVFIPKNVERLEMDTFYDCDALYRVEFEEGSELSYIGDYCFANCDLLYNVTIPDSVVTIDYCAFELDVALEYVLISENSNLQTIANGSFRCTKINSIVIPSGVTEIGYSAFSSCNALNTVYYEGTETNWYYNLSIGSSNDDLKNAMRYYYCENLEGTKGDYLWRYVNGTPTVWDTINLLSVTANGVSRLITTTQLTLVFSAHPGGFGINNIEINGANPIMLSGSGTTFTLDINLTLNEDGDTIWVDLTNTNNNIIGNREIEVVVYVSAATTIDGIDYTLTSDNSAYVVTNATLSNIPQSVTILSSFRGLPVISIGDNAFSGCSSLTAIELPSSITTIGSYAFQNCTSLTRFTVLTNITSIGAGAFYGCTSLSYLTIISDSLSIGGYAFANCTSLASVTIPSGVTSMGVGVFDNCNYLTIYTSYAQAPTGWAQPLNISLGGGYIGGGLLGEESWNIDARPVFWGCEVVTLYTAPYVGSVNLSIIIVGAARIENADAVNGISNPTRYGYVFGGWYDNSSFIGGGMSSGALAILGCQGTYYAKWTLDTGLL